jgi:hypothetical protein
MVENKCDYTNKIIVYISFVIQIIFNFFVIFTLYKLEEAHCNCSNIPEKRFIKEWFMFYFVIFFIIILSFMFSGVECWKTFIEGSSFSVIYFILGLINIIMLIRLFIYIRILKNTCECGYGKKEKFLYWYLLIIFSMLLFLLSLVIILSIITFTLLSKNNLNDKIKYNKLLSKK